jgi:excisionase family DNA binding protein
VRLRVQRHTSDNIGQERIQMMNPAERTTVSIMKACELVSVSRRTIYNWLALGKVEYVRTAGGSVRIFVDTLWRDPAATGDAKNTAAA